MVFTTSPYVEYFDGKSKEFIQLNKCAMIDFKASEQFDLTQKTADSFSECMDRTFKIYDYYGYLCQLPITMTVAPAGTVTLGDYANLIETQNLIWIYTVLNNDNIIWGDNSFTDVTPR